MKPVGEQTDVSSFGAWRAVDEVRDTLERHIGQRRCEFLFREARFEQILGRDDRSQPVANRMNGYEQMVEAVASLHDLMIDPDEIEPCLPLTGTRRRCDQTMTHDIGGLLDRKLRQ